MAKQDLRTENFTFEKLDAMLQFKVTKGFCADYMDVSEDTIERRIKAKHNMGFTAYHKLKLQRTGLKLQQKAIEQALAGQPAMMIFCLKNLAGWSDKLDTNLSAKIEINIDKDDSRL